MLYKIVSQLTDRKENGAMKKINRVNRITGEITEVRLYNPAEKARHAIKMVKRGAKTKDGRIVSDWYRGKMAGYLDARQEQSRIFKKKHPRYKSKFSKK